MTIRLMTIEDLQTVLGWATEEGWNPGLDDAVPFRVADSNGFFVKEHNGQAIAAISVVNHDDNFAFLGLYICRPEFRGQGFGMHLWTHALAHAANRCVGLDGVPDQQENYAKSGFKKFGKTARFEGEFPTVENARVRELRPAEVKHLVACDAAATGLDRALFSEKWLLGSDTRRTMVLIQGAAVVGFATFRQCGLGLKVGPFHADAPEDAAALLAARPAGFQQGPMFIDVPDSANDFSRLLLDAGFAPIFETARMYNGQPPRQQPPDFYAIATMEVG